MHLFFFIFSWSKESTLGQYSGLGLKVSLTTESHGPSQLNAIIRKLRMYNFNLLNAVRFGMVYTGVSEEGKPSLRSHLIKLTYNPQQNQIKTIQATVKLGLASKTNSQQQQLYYTIISKQQQQQQEKSYPTWQQILPAKLVAYPISHQLQGHSQRQQKVQQIFEETGVQTGRVVVAEVDVQLIGSSSTHSSMK